MRRGEVWWAELPAPACPRPVVLVSRDDAYTVRRFVIVASVSARMRGIAAEVPLGPEDGVVKPSVVNLDVLSTVDKQLLRRRITKLDEAKVAALDEALRFAVGLR